MSGSIGFAIGPLIGTGLYITVGYPLTMCLYAAIYSPCIITSYIFVHVKRNYVMQGEAVKPSEILKHVQILLIVLVCVSVYFVVGVVEPMISWHMQKKYGVSSMDTGMYWVGYSMVYAITNAAYVFLPNHLVKSHSITAGAIICGISCWMSGELFIEAGIWLSATGFITVSIGLAMVYVPTLPAIMEVCVFDLNQLNCLYH